MLIFQTRAIRALAGPKTHEIVQTPKRGHTPSLIRVFAVCLIGKQGHKASESDQTDRISVVFNNQTC